jgi:hypothetical protein
MTNKRRLLRHAATSEPFEKIDHVITALSVNAGWVQNLDPNFNQLQATNCVVLQQAIYAAISLEVNYCVFIGAIYPKT